MKSLPIPLLRLLICIQFLGIVMIMSLMTTISYLNLIGQRRHDTSTSLARQRRRPRLVWKYKDGSSGLVKVPIHIGEYQLLSERLGYESSIDYPLDGNFFKCVDEPTHSPCNVYRQIAPFRIINYDGADITFTDMIPGLQSVVTYKAGLVSLGGKYIPEGFHIPNQTKEFLQYAYSIDKKMKWMQKDTRHRGVRVKEFHDLDLSQESLIQEFIPNPFLIDGKKFSIGVYVAFSSGNPLRAYVLNSQWTLRFCSKVYNPHDLSDNQTYITDGVEFNSIMIREVDSLRNYSLGLQYSTLQSLRAYFDSIGSGNWSSVRFQIVDAVKDVLSSRHHPIIENINASDINTRHFQFTRWDFVLDSEFKVHVIEANTIPGMYCLMFSVYQLDKHFCINVVYNSFRAMGIASLYDFHRTSIHYVIRDSDLNVGNAICYTSTCNQCNTQECQLCTKCLSNTQKYILKSVLWEHLRRGEMKLVYPFASNKHKRTENSSRQSLENDTLTTEWLRLKCLKDIQWCAGG